MAGGGVLDIVKLLIIAWVTIQIAPSVIQLASGVMKSNAVDPYDDPRLRGGTYG
jgi:hypothetical protein